MNNLQANESWTFVININFKELGHCLKLYD